MKRVKSLYIIENTRNGRKYVGSTERPAWRFKEHIKALQHHRHKIPLFQEDYDKYGEDAFVFKVVSEFVEIGGHNDEYEMMRKLKTYDEKYGYNYMDPVMNNDRKNNGLSYRKKKRRETDSCIYINVMKRLTEAGISIHRLEKEAGIANGTIRKWKDHDVRADTLYKVAGYFNCSMEDLMKK